MKIVKSASIRGVVITPQNIKELAQVVFNEYERDYAGADERGRLYLNLRFTLNSADGVQYEDNNMSLFLDDGILNTRKIMSIELWYHSAKDDKIISVGIFHSENPDSSNVVRISGHDEGWVNGIFTKLQEVVGNFKVQTLLSFVQFSLLGLLFVSCFIIGSWMLAPVLGNLVTRVISFTGEAQKSATIGTIVLIFRSIGIALSMMGGFELAKKIDALYPNVELLVGPQHRQVEAIRRRRLYGLLAIWIIPSVLAIALGIIFR